MLIYPKYISLNMWAADLYISYGGYPWPVLLEENKWEDWATNVCKIGIFYDAEVPVPLTKNSNLQINAFKSWQDWALQAYYKIIEYEIQQDIVKRRGF